MDDLTQDVASDLIDLSDIDFSRLTELDSPVLTAALTYIRYEVENPEEAVAGFQSSL